MRAVIGGSGLEQLDGLVIEHRHQVDTPYGEPSAPIVQGRYEGQSLLFLSRHGERHQWPPHRVNYRANIHALKQLGAQQIAAVAAVGGLVEPNGPGALNVPDQILDYTWGRPQSFYDDGQGVEHIDFSQPYTPALRQSLLEAAQTAGEPAVDGGVYAATQGPRLETAAEVQRLIRDGAHLVGMTGMPEAALAREAELDYACLAVVANWGAGIADSELSLDEIYQTLAHSMQRVRHVLAAWVAA